MKVVKARKTTKTTTHVFSLNIRRAVTGKRAVTAVNSAPVNMAEETHQGA